MSAAGGGGGGGGARTSITRDQKSVNQQYIEEMAKKLKKGDALRYADFGFDYFKAGEGENWVLVCDPMAYEIMKDLLPAEFFVKRFLLCVTMESSMSIRDFALTYNPLLIIDEAKRERKAKANEEALEEAAAIFSAAKAAIAAVNRKEEESKVRAAAKVAAKAAELKRQEEEKRKVEEAKHKKEEAKRLAAAAEAAEGKSLPFFLAPTSSHT